MHTPIFVWTRVSVDVAWVLVQVISLIQFASKMIVSNSLMPNHTGILALRLWYTD